jgi:type IX secretion system PorP/SprF family membrane protein
MKNNNLKLISFLFFVFCVQVFFAQDIHFSQYGMSPINSNPATTGLFDGDVRAGGIFRSQWASVPIPYTTVSFFGDMRLGQNKLGDDRLGVGFIFNNDVCGDSKYGTTQIYFPISYIKKIKKDSSLFLSFSLQPGISSSGFKTQALTFDSQYDGNQYQSSFSSQENFSATNQTKFDLNSGAMLQYNILKRGFVQAGLSIFHLTTPKQSYFNNTSISIDMKTNSYLMINYPVATMLDASVELLYSRQGKYHELVTGANIKYIFSTKHYQTVFIGTYLRAKDAFIARVGMDYKTWKFSMSYDVNTSGFNAATNRKGAVEFALIYIFKKEIPFIAKKRACPIYM